MPSQIFGWVWKKMHDSDSMHFGKQSAKTHFTDTIFCMKDLSNINLKRRERVDMGMQTYGPCLRNKDVLANRVIPDLAVQIERNNKS